jgi:hypothetical protein
MTPIIWRFKNIYTCFPRKDLSYGSLFPGWTKHLPNMSLECYRDFNPLGDNAP